MLIASQQGGELPNGYTKVNYIEQTGQQYIDTSYHPNNNTECEIEFGGTYGNGTLLVPFGTRANGGTTEQYGIIVFKSGNRPQIRFGNARTTVGGTGYADFSGLHKLQVFVETRGSVSRADLFIDDILIPYSPATYDFTCTNPLYLLALRNGSRIVFDNAGTAQLGRCTFTESSVKVWDGIPALDPNRKPCMFDTVSQTPFYNAGTGDFLYG